ncbi:collagen alpha-1(I) chain-like isoform X2 [Mustela erminea]|uniref:collagen alpha-1(I) chain-like isoform X2 n=1 Tax=Mustela erminea TaxID=36723 RepID=UPI001386A70D|nr:collagen alpha-1(I) chain-like isoform X2 [Mustela erminea]XP_032201336.1 collagen alpha-1(I) chain-like isoform X2 [Mustela erminea]
MHACARARTRTWLSRGEAPSLRGRPARPGRSRQRRGEGRAPRRVPPPGLRPPRGSGFRPRYLRFPLGGRGRVAIPPGASGSPGLLAQSPQGGVEAPGCRAIAVSPTGRTPHPGAVTRQLGPGGAHSPGWARAPLPSSRDPARGPQLPAGAAAGARGRACRRSSPVADRGPRRPGAPSARRSLGPVAATPRAAARTPRSADRWPGSPLPALTTEVSLRAPPEKRNRGWFAANPRGNSTFSPDKNISSMDLGTVFVLLKFLSPQPGPGLGTQEKANQPLLAEGTDP